MFSWEFHDFFKTAIETATSVSTHLLKSDDLLTAYEQLSY